MKKIQSISLLFVGLLGGFFVSFALSVAADKNASSSLPIEDLKKFANVYGAIKANYVEDVKDSKLIKGAVSGMLSGLDPHSTYLDEDAFKDLQAAEQHPLSVRDSKGRLRCGAAIGVVHAFGDDHHLDLLLPLGALPLPPWPLGEHSSSSMRLVIGTKGRCCMTSL